MELKIQKIGNEYGVVLPKTLLETLAVSEGSLLNAESLNGVLQMTPVDPGFSRQIEAFLRTEELHESSYRELAK